jgi:hypothetical protein
MEYISKIDKDICTVIDTKTKQEKLITKADLKEYVLQGNEVCGVNAQQDLFYELQVIGNPKIVTKSKLGYKPRKIFDVCYKYVIFLHAVADNIQTLPDYYSYIGGVYSYENGEVCVLEDKTIFVPKWADLPFLVRESGSFVEIPRKQVQLHSNNLMATPDIHNNMYCKKYFEQFQLGLSKITEEMKDYPRKEINMSLSQFLEKLRITFWDDCYYTLQTAFSNTDSFGWIKFNDCDKWFIYNVSTQNRDNPLYKQLDSLDSVNDMLYFSDIDVTKKDISGWEEWEDYVKYYSRVRDMFLNPRDCKWEYIGDFSIKKDDIIVTELYYNRASRDSTGKLLPYKKPVQSKFSMIKHDPEYLLHPEDFIGSFTGFECFEGVFEVHIGALCDWVIRGRAENPKTEDAKRAILGLGTCSVTSQNALTRLERGRNGDWVIPKSVKEVRPGAIVFTKCKEKVILSGEPVVFRKGSLAFLGGVLTTYTFDLKTTDFRGVYTLVNAFRELSMEGAFIRYIFDEDMFLEQLKGVLLAAGGFTDKHYMGFSVDSEDGYSIAVGVTDITERFLSIEFYDKLYREIESYS